MLIFGPILGDILHPKILEKNLWRRSLIGCRGCAGLSGIGEVWEGVRLCPKILVQ